MSGSTIDVEKLEKQLAKEAKHDASQLATAQKALGHAEKADAKAHKNEAKAEKAVDKAIKDVNKTEKVVNQAAHKHDNAISHHQKAEKDLQAQKNAEIKAEQEVQTRKATLDQVAAKKQELDRQRDLKLANAHNQRAGSMDTTGTGSAPTSAH